MAAAIPMTSARQPPRCWAPGPSPRAVWRAATNEFGTAADNDIAPNIYIRWAEFSTFCGLFLNGGHGERRLWKRSWPELEIIRKFSWLHTELVPYMYSYVVECHNGAPPLMRPQAQGKFHYLFGNELLVAPIYADKLDWTVSLPPGRWRYLFHDDEVTSGPGTGPARLPARRIPGVCPRRRGHPAEGHPALHGIWRHQFSGFHHLAGLPGRQEPVHPVASGITSQTGEDHAGRGLRPDRSNSNSRASTSLTSSASSLQSKPARVVLDGTELAEGDSWQFDAAHQRLIIKTRDYAQGRYEIRSQ